MKTYFVEILRSLNQTTKLNIASLVVAIVALLVVVFGFSLKKQDPGTKETVSEKTTSPSPSNDGGKKPDTPGSIVNNITINNSNSNGTTTRGSQQGNGKLSTSSPPKSEPQQHPSPQTTPENSAKVIAHQVGIMTPPVDASDAVYLRNYNSFIADQARLKFLVDNYPTWNLLIAIQARTLMSEIYHAADNMKATPSTKYVSSITGNLDLLTQDLIRCMGELDREIRAIQRSQQP